MKTKIIAAVALSAFASLAFAQASTVVVDTGPAVENSSPQPTVAQDRDRSLDEATSGEKVGNPTQPTTQPAEQPTALSKNTIIALN